jgi:hypothetical protein
MSSTFPQFSSKARGGKAPHHSPPPHTIQTRGKCDLEIGPHIFPETVFYEVHYLPSQSQLTHLPTAGVQSTAPHSGAYTPHAQSPHPVSTGEGSSVLGLPTPSSPLMSSLNKVTQITPELINRVNSAASSNPILANLVQLAASQVATPEQLKTLGLLIQSLASPEIAQLASQSSSPIFQGQPNQASSLISPQGITTPNPPIKEFDLVIEFRETPSERWVFPRGPVVFDQDNNLPGVSYDTLVKTIIPFNSPVGNAIATNQGLSAQISSPTETLHVATLRLRRTPLAVWDTLSRWAGGEEKMQHSRNLIEALVGCSKQIHSFCSLTRIRIRRTGCI